MFGEDSKYRAVFDLIDEMIFILDDQFNVIDYNHATIDILGDEPENLIDLSVKRLIQQEHWYSFDEVFQIDQQLHEHNLQFVKENGQKLNAKAHIYKIQSEEGSFAILIVKDITDEKNKELELLRFTNAIQYAVNPIQITDTAGIMVYVNPAFEKASGYTQSELIGQNPSILSGKKQSPEFWKKVWDKILAGKVWVGQIENLRKDGTPLYAESIISPIVDSEGKLVGFLGVHHDITEQRLLEQHLFFAQQLGSIGTLAAGIAHEIGNPLTSISALTQVIQKTSTDEKVKNKLEQVKHQINRIADVIRQLVDFSRPAQKNSKPTNINQLLKNSVNMIKFGQQVDNIKFAFELSQDLPNVKIYSEQIMQVFASIIMNSVDSIEDKDGIITILTRKIDDRIEIIIGDNGKGIPYDVQERIFEPFFTTKEVGKGLGLGLWVCFGIVKNYNGDISVESQPGIGTRIKISLPLKGS